MISRTSSTYERSRKIFCLENLKEMYLWGDLATYKRMALNWNFKKEEHKGTAGIHLAKDMGPVMGLCEYDKEHIDSVTGAEFPR
jgi:hypothetical protein